MSEAPARNHPRRAVTSYRLTIEAVIWGIAPRQAFEPTVGDEYRATLVGLEAAPFAMALLVLDLSSCAVLPLA